MSLSPISKIASPLKRPSTAVRTPKKRNSDINNNSEILQDLSASIIAQSRSRTIKPSAQEVRQMNSEGVAESSSINLDLADRVKKNASYIIQLVSCTYKNSKDMMKMSHSKFFQNINQWFREKGKIAQGKQSSEPVSSIEELESMRENIQNNIGNLHIELSKWKELDSTVLTLDMTKPELDEVLPISHDQFYQFIAEFICSLDRLSTGIHSSDPDVAHAKAYAKALYETILSSNAIPLDDKQEISGKYHYM